MPKKLHYPDHHHIHPLAGVATRRNFIASLISTTVAVPWTFGQAASEGTSDIAERFRKMSEDYEKEGLAPFKGITANGEVVPGLFQIRPTGVSSEAVRNAAVAFIATLTPVELARTIYPVDDIEWRKWMNQHFYLRQGICFAEMTDDQREAAFSLMRVSLSSKGFELTRNIMRLNETLAEMAGDHAFLGEWLYYIQIFGRPSATEAWGWKLEGHHAIINYFALGDQVVMTPLFIGSEPVKATSGKYNGLEIREILQREQNDGLEMLKVLSDCATQTSHPQYFKNRQQSLPRHSRTMW
ncbi:MAG: DUF3500 domain-containing protein [Acidobacteria bacterium]|nr:DUF3500 domain-containing protein [Acidobacteriota bacterium]